MKRFKNIFKSNLHSVNVLIRTKISSKLHKLHRLFGKPLYNLFFNFLRFINYYSYRKFNFASGILPSLEKINTFKIPIIFCSENLNFIYYCKFNS